MVLDGTLTSKFSLSWLGNFSMKQNLLMALTVVVIASTGCASPNSSLIDPHTSVMPKIISVPERDTDKDGVVDRLDQCPGTPISYAVDDVGCHMYEQFTAAMELEIRFDNDSSVVKDDFLSEVKKVADFLNEYPDTQVEIGGHTSAPASAEYNQVLSERRAKAVAEILKSNFSIAENRVFYNGYGESRLKDPRDTQEAHDTNRRIEAIIYAVEQRAVLREGYHYKEQSESEEKMDKNAQEQIKTEEEPESSTLSQVVEAEEKAENSAQNQVEEQAETLQ